MSSLYGNCHCVATAVFTAGMQSLKVYVILNKFYLYVFEMVVSFSFHYTFFICASLLSHTYYTFCTLHDPNCRIHFASYERKVSCHV